jgi:hypothetical protein
MSICICQGIESLNAESMDTYVANFKYATDNLACTYIRYSLGSSSQNAANTDFLRAKMIKRVLTGWDYVIHIGPRDTFYNTWVKLDIFMRDAFDTPNKCIIIGNPLTLNESTLCMGSGSDTCKSLATQPIMLKNSALTQTIVDNWVSLMERNDCHCCTSGLCLEQALQNYPGAFAQIDNMNIKRSEGINNLCKLNVPCFSKKNVENIGNIGNFENFDQPPSIQQKYTPNITYAMYVIATLAILMCWWLYINTI